jgi:transcriptional regulator with XRE-family HTH domain
MSFGAQFREKRKQANLTQRQIENESKIRQSNISAIEKARRVPEASTQKKLIDAWEKLSKRNWI